ADLTQVGRSLGLELAEPLLNEYAHILEAVWQDYDRLDAIATPPAPPRYPRGPGQVPTDNRYNAWYVRTDIQGAASGKLA
ncbi:hypothetical protein Q6264_30780, partial [Klebsiella pneumoniae]|nr:hypothetical protein [Klebsiella pneumoniae]